MGKNVHDQVAYELSSFTSLSGRLPFSNSFHGKDMPCQTYKCVSKFVSLLDASDSNYVRHKTVLKTSTHFTVFIGCPPVFVKRLMAKASPIGAQ
jgi:hypothetical protein